MKDRLIELLINTGMGITEASFVADCLIDNGVIVPPCKVGDVVYYITGIYGTIVSEAKVEEIYYNGDSFSFHVCHDYDYFTIQQEETFLTREDAEAALKERGGHDE